MTVNEKIMVVSFVGGIWFTTFLCMLGTWLIKEYTVSPKVIGSVQALVCIVAFMAFLVLIGHE